MTEADAPSATVILTVCCLAFAVIVAVTSIALLVHHAVTGKQRALTLDRLEGAAEMLAPALVAVDDLSSIVKGARERWGDRAVSTVLRRARTSLAGSVRDHITAALEEMGEVDRLAALADAREGWERAQALRHLAASGGRRAARLLERATGDRVPEVRRAAREGLLALAEPETVRRAVAAYRKEATQQLAWRRSFYARLANVAADELVRLVRAGELPANEENLALDALAVWPGSGAQELAREKLESENADVRAAAARLFGCVGGAKAAGPLLRCLDDAAWFVRAAGARALAGVPCDRFACEKLGERLTDESWWVRANASTTLTKHPPHGKNLLFGALDSEDPYARDAASAALALVDLPADERLRLNCVTASHEGTIVPFPLRGESVS